MKEKSHIQFQESIPFLQEMKICGLNSKKHELSIIKEKENSSINIFETERKIELIDAFKILA